MSRPRVLVTHWVHPEVLDELSGECDVRANRSRESFPRDEILRRVRDVEACLAFMPDRVDREFLEHAPHLRIVAGAFKGYDNVDVEACTARGVWVTVIPDLLTEPTAELAVALLLSLGRRVREGDRLVRSGAFAGWRPTLYGSGLAGRTLGLLGMGAVGQATAIRLGGFSSRLIYHDLKPLPPERERELRVERVAQEELLARSDYVLVTLPLTTQTRALIGPEALGVMKPGACLVNVGRGSVVDERAVAAALKAGRLGGYASDVFAFEDLSRPDRPLQIPPELLSPELRTVFTPHLGSADEGVRLEIARKAARSILGFLRGDDLPEAVNQACLKPAPAKGGGETQEASPPTAPVEPRGPRPKGSPGERSGEPER
jgi:phosphonate dehydrogenase